MSVESIKRIAKQRGMDSKGIKVGKFPGTLDCTLWIGLRVAMSWKAPPMKCTVIGSVSLLWIETSTREVRPL
jgi:hypothetical protein